MKQRGFTLLEVLVAFTLLAVLFGVLFEVFAGGLASVRKGEAHGYATLLAQSKLAELSVGPQFAAGSRSGAFDTDTANGQSARYRWTFTLAHYSGDGLGTVDRGPVVPFIATIDVRWDDGAREQKVSLSNIVLGTR